jgi:uncharacterized protein (TIGR03435 family)
MLRVTVCSALFLNVSVAQVPSANSDPRFVVAAIHSSNPREFGAPSGCQTTPGLMLQTLLTERFKLTLHRELRRGETMCSRSRGERAGASAGGRW